MKTLRLTQPQFSHVCRTDEDSIFLKEVAADYYDDDAITWEFDYDFDEENGYINYETEHQEKVAVIR